MLRACILGLLLTCCVAEDLPNIPRDFNTSNEVLSAISNNIANKFEQEYMAYLKTGIESPSLQKLSLQLAQMHSKKDLFTKQRQDLGAADQFFSCTLCRATVNIMTRMVRDEDGELNGPNNEAIAKDIAIKFCERLNIQTAEICAGLFDSNWPIMEYIIRNTVIDSQTFCSLFWEIGFCKVKNPEYNWSIKVDGNGAAVTGPKSGLPSKSDNDLHILHLTDIHYDPLYEEDTLAECDESLCCQRHKDVAMGTSKAAGYWGDYRDCDAPWRLIENTLEHIKRTHPKIDYIYQTGDVVDHMMWSTSVEKNTQVLTKFNDKLAEIFPNVPVYACIGNHEPHPLNAFSPDDVPQEINTKWLYEHLYKDWSKWLPADTQQTLLKGGYYTVSPKPGFRIIALNSNDCYTDNWWLYYSGTNKMPQLEWLHDTLLAAEKTGENVHILTHIPSGDSSCWSVWAREYNRILERFHNTVSGIFNGHSHKDEMNVHYSGNGHAIAMTWNGGSLTTYSYKNPNYRLYQVEPKDLQVVDHETWIFNLTEANEQAPKEPVWYKEYIFSEEFTTDLSPAGIDTLLNQMADNPNLLRKFWRFKMTTADPSLKQGCDKNCLLSTICRIATTVNDQRKRCDELRARLSTALDNEDTTAAPATTVETTTGGSGGETTTKDPNDGANGLTALNVLTTILFVLVSKYLA